jgi:bacterioferritin (cytochrome b1)
MYRTTKKSPKQIEEHQMFGRSLTEVMQHPLNKDRSVPIVLEKAIKYLEEKGKYRKIVESFFV